jgi:hypothetical protein
MCVLFFYYTTNVENSDIVNSKMDYHCYFIQRVANKKKNVIRDRLWKKNDHEAMKREGDMEKVQSKETELNGKFSESKS